MEGVSMGTTVPTIAIVIELALMVYSLAMKSRQEKTRSVLHIIAFAVFLLLTLASVIEWSFRWYGLAALLFIWAACGTYNLFNKSENGTFQARQVVMRSVLTLLLVFISLTPALVFPQHEPLAATGPYTVATARYTYTDGSRIEQFSSSRENRRVNVAFWYPRNLIRNETYPLIVFSHGGLGTENSNESLYLELASHGFVVCSIGHPYHALWTEDEDGRITFVSMDYFRELRQEDAKRDKQQSYRYYQKWMETRTGDINFVMDTILEKASNDAGGVYSLVDVERVGVMGHSLGGSAALGVPRQRDDIDAVIALESPFLYDIVGVANDEFIFSNKSYPAPVLNVYSDASWNQLSEWAQYARNYELLSDPRTTAFSLHINGAGHFSLTDLPLASPLLVRLLEGGEGISDSKEYLQIVNKVCLEFFERYLKDRGEFTSYGFHRGRRL